MKILKRKIEKCDLGGFQCLEAKNVVGEKKKKKPDSSMSFSLCSQTYKRMIKDLYFISGL
jgi:hypothetical protein